MRSHAVRSFNGPPSTLPFCARVVVPLAPARQPFPFRTRRTRGGTALFVLLWFSEWQGPDLRRACFQSLRRHIFNGLFTGEEFSDWSTTIVVMAAFDSGQLASLWSLTEVFGSMCLILNIPCDRAKHARSSQALRQSQLDGTQPEARQIGF
jgi:hypothetical protein